MAKQKTSKQMERHLKGTANHYRIEVLLLIAKYGALTLEDIIKHIGAVDKTIAAHVRRLHGAGLINKQYRGRFVEHTLSPYGKMFTKFLQEFKSAL